VAMGERGSMISDEGAIGMSNLGIRASDGNDNVGGVVGNNQVGLWWQEGNSWLCEQNHKINKLCTGDGRGVVQAGIGR